MTFDFGGGAGGALTGAASGALLGSAFPGIGTAIGAGAGGLFGGLGGLFKNNAISGYQARNTQQPIISDHQKQLMDALGQLGLTGLQKGSDFGSIADQARQQFSEQTVPGIAERFSGLGAQHSSAFGQQLGAAGAGLEGNLAAMQSSHDLGRQGLFSGLAGLGLGNQFQSQYSPAQPGLNQIIPPALLAALPDLLRLLKGRI